MQADGSVENAADRADAKPHLHVISVFAGLHQFFAAGKALGNSIRVRKKTPDGQRRDSVECKLPFNFHRESAADYADFTDWNPFNPWLLSRAFDGRFQGASCIDSRQVETIFR